MGEHHEAVLQQPLRLARRQPRRETEHADHARLVRARQHRTPAHGVPDQHDPLDAVVDLGEQPAQVGGGVGGITVPPPVAVAQQGDPRPRRHLLSRGCERPHAQDGVPPVVRFLQRMLLTAMGDQHEVARCRRCGHDIEAGTGHRAIAPDGLRP